MTLGGFINDPADRAATVAAREHAVLLREADAQAYENGIASKEAELDALRAENRRLIEEIDQLWDDNIDLELAARTCTRCSRHIGLKRQREHGIVAAWRRRRAKQA
jgi:hypothetical protein